MVVIEVCNDINQTGSLLKQKKHPKIKMSFTKGTTRQLKIMTATVLFYVTSISTTHCQVYTNDHNPFQFMFLHHTTTHASKVYIYERDTGNSRVHVT